MSNSMPNFKRSVKALEKRITQKDAAAYIGVSTSTLRRYKQGKVKTPNPETVNKIQNLWQSFKTVKPTNDNHLKRERIQKRTGWNFEGTKYYKVMDSTNFIYTTNDFSAANIEDIFKHIIERHCPKEFAPPFNIQAKLVGITDEGKKQKFSTPIMHFDNIEDMLEAINGLLAKPSKTLKTAMKLELIGKVFNHNER